MAEVTKNWHVDVRFNLCVATEEQAREFAEGLKNGSLLGGRLCDLLDGGPVPEGDE